jgi:hypothetical protein
MQATDVEWTVRSPMKTYGYCSDAHDAMMYQMQSTDDSTSSLRAPLPDDDNVAAFDQLKNMSLPCDISSRDYADGTEHTTAGTPTASLMEVDSPTPSPGSIHEPASNWESKQQSLVAEASALLAVGREASSSEGLCSATYRQLIDGLLQQCNMLTMERDTTARTLCEVRKDLIEQQVSRMEDGVNLEDINTRLWAFNSALEAKLRSQDGPRRIEPLHSSFSRCVCSSADGNRKRKRYGDVVDLGLSRKRRRCA